MGFMINEAQSDQSVHIEQIDHGKFASISSTSLLLMVGAFGPALKAGSPVTGSVTIFIRCGRFLRGVNTIRPSSIFASGWPNIKSAAQRPWQNDLSLGGYLGLHGKTILLSCPVLG